MSGHPADWRREIPHKCIPKESVAKTASINSILGRCGSSVRAPRALALHIHRHYQIAVHTREHLKWESTTQTCRGNLVQENGDETAGLMTLCICECSQGSDAEEQWLEKVMTYHIGQKQFPAF